MEGKGKAAEIHFPALFYAGIALGLILLVLSSSDCTVNGALNAQKGKHDRVSVVGIETVDANPRQKLHEGGE